MGSMRNRLDDVTALAAGESNGLRNIHVTLEAPAQMEKELLTFSEEQKHREIGGAHSSSSSFCPFR